jgi:hypothetical protein
MGWVKSELYLGMEKYYLPFARRTHCPCDFKRRFWYWYLRYAYQWRHLLRLLISIWKLEKVIRKEVLGGSFDKDNYIEERVWATAKMELRCLFLWFIKRSDKDGKTHYCFMPMVHMVIPWMLFFIKIILTRQRFCLCHCAHSRWWRFRKTMVWRR